MFRLTAEEKAAVIFVREESLEPSAGGGRWFGPIRHCIAIDRYVTFVYASSRSGSHAPPFFDISPCARIV
jgi:hypothetical protein